MDGQQKNRDRRWMLGGAVFLFFIVAPEIVIMISEF